MKILVVKTSSLGDVTHALPAVTDALKALPDAIVDWAVEPAFGDIVRLHPGVRAVHGMPVRRWRREALSPQTWREIGASRRALRAERYDVVIDAQGLLKSAWLARFARRPVHGFDHASIREMPAASLYAFRHRVPTDLHAITRNRVLVGKALGYEPDLATVDYGIAAPDAPAMIAGQRRLAMLLHGTTWPSKRWPFGHFVELSRILLDRGLEPVVTWSDEEERGFADALRAEVSEVTVLPISPLREVAGALAACEIVIGVDTGLIHLAAALGRTTITLFASTSPSLTRPVGPSAQLVEATLDCVPCRQRNCRLVPAGTVPPCHATIGPERVAELLGRSA